MTREFELDVREWMPSVPPDDDTTIAQLGIRLYKTLITDVADRESRSISDTVRVSARTLAAWFVQNYWRLTSERTIERDDLDWLVAHNMASAGSGYAWPKLIISSDGRFVRIDDRSFEKERYADVRFIGERRPHFLPLAEFTGEVSRFVDLVVRRLRETSRNDPLIGAWEDLVTELSQPESSAYRRLEATLGYGVDEAPEAEVLEWDRAASELGDAAVGELLAASASLEEAMALRDAARSANARIDVAKLEPLVAKTRRTVALETRRASRPASQMAAFIRQELRVSGPIAPDAFADLFGHYDSLPGPNVREQAAGWDGEAEIRVAVRKNNTPGVRFEMARLVGDYMAFGDGPFRPVLDTYSWRQQFQRSFGQAFLAPIELIRERKPSRRDWTGRDIESAAEHFHVSSWVIHNALRDHRDISRTHLIDRESGLLEAI